MKADLIERFLNWANENEWNVERASEIMELPEEVTARYKNIPKDWLKFMTQFSDITNDTDDMWFFTCENIFDGGWSYNDFENMSLDAADGDEEWSSKIKEFWDNTLPIVMSVGGDYQYFAIKLDTGKVVQGWEPEFEYPMVVADSFEDFLEKVIAGEIYLVV